jgi:hypothetical protein
MGRAVAVWVALCAAASPIPAPLAPVPLTPPLPAPTAVVPDVAGGAAGVVVCANTGTAAINAMAHTEPIKLCFNIVFSFA